jgi:hypothetical protein
MGGKKLRWGEDKMLEEVVATPLPDWRLNKRLDVIVSKLSAAPERSIPHALGKKDTKSTYEFLDNRRVSHAALVEGLGLVTLERVAGEVESGRKRLYLVQDTTSFDFKHHPATTGMGGLDNPHGWGFLAHTTLAVSEQGVPLGVWEQQVWMRDEATKGKSAQRHERAFADKESYKWVNGLPPLLNPLEDVGAECVTVCDREGHIYEFLDEVVNRSQAVIVRACQGRSFTLDGVELFTAVAQLPVQDLFMLHLARHPERAERDAELALRFGTVTLRCPQLTLQVVEVQEVAPPRGQKPVHWLLLTTLPVTTLAQAQTIVQAYTYRWLIERFHYVLKSGCHLEERQLRTQKRLTCLLGVFNYVAWKLLWLTYQTRLTPTDDCTAILEPDEWQALYGTIHQTTAFPLFPPTLHEVIRWIAQLGGFLGRKGDGDPGVKVLWRGWTRLQDIVATWRLLRYPPKNVGNA